MAGAGALEFEPPVTEFEHPRIAVPGSAGIRCSPEPARVR
jgi:hypothetical protein